MKKLLLLCHSITFVAALYSQHTNVKWQSSIEPRKVFIENKSQYNGKILFPGTEILFGTDREPKMMYFTKSGMTFRFEKREVKFVEPDEQNEGKGIGKRQREDEDFDITYQRDMVQMHWLDANPNAEVLAMDKAEGYESFSMGAKCISHVNAYNAILYKNMYEGIDIEYRFDPIEGIKYTIILHPGADASQIKMKYSFNGRINLDEEGNAHLPTLFGDIIDHAPKTAYADAGKETLPSRFIQSGKSISFELGNYDHNRTVIIDPWTVTPPLPNSNKAFYIKADDSGNAYVYGGDSPFRLVKYNAAGAYQWTYNTPWDSATAWAGTLIVDRAGNSYITSGSLAAIAKVDTGGNQVWLTIPLNQSEEYWCLTFNCDQSQLIAGGTRLPTGGYVYNIDTANGLETDTLLIATVSPGFMFSNPNEGRSMTYSPNGNYYCLVLDTIASFNSSFGLNYRNNSNFIYSYTSPAYGFTPQGQSCIKATSTFIYTITGASIYKRDISNGAIIDSAIIPGGITISPGPLDPGRSPENGGIDIDSCGYLYVGSLNKVIQFDSNLIVIDSFATPGAVYDVCVSNNGQLLACGQGFAISLAVNACSPVKSICSTILQASTTQSNPPCFGQCTGTATANIINGTAPFIYQWSDGQTTQTASFLCAGPYSLTVTDQFDGNSVTASVIITQPPAMEVLIASNNTTCGNNNGSAIANVTTGTGPYIYAWSTGANTDYISNLSAGTYTITVTGGAGCTATASGLIEPSTAPTVTITSDKTEMCPGDTAYICAPAGFITYLWDSGQTTQCIYAINAGTYYTAITDSATCTASSNQLNISIYPLPSVTINISGDTLIASNGISFQWYLNGTAISNANSNEYVGTENGIYAVAITDSNGCTAFSDTALFALGIHNVNGNEGLKIYPNPLYSGAWQIEINSKWLNARCEIYDAGGKMVYNAALENLKTQLTPEVASGVYILRVSSSKGNINLKLVKF